MSHPTICLNMIVRNEAHVVREVLDCVAGHISTWLIVDTGSQDGTQDVIREHMAGLGIPGELVEREWRDFGHNRTEALNLAAGRADYIWVIDADDLLIGTPDFSRLDADCYELRYGPPDGFNPRRGGVRGPRREPAIRRTRSAWQAAHMKPNCVAHAGSLFVEHEPVPADQVLSGQPHTGVGSLGNFAGLEVGVWEMTPGVMSDVEADEIFVVLSGAATVEFTDGATPLTLGPGDVVRLGAGTQTVWTVTETLRKVYLI